MGARSRRPHPFAPISSRHVDLHRPTARPRRPGMRDARRWWGKHGHLFVFLAPALLIYGLFMAYPLVSSLSYSLYEWDGYVRKGFTGLDELRHRAHPLALPGALLGRAIAQRALLRPHLRAADHAGPLRRGLARAQVARLRLLPGRLLPAPHALARGRRLPVADAAQPHLGRRRPGAAPRRPRRLGPAVARPERFRARHDHPGERLGLARLPDPGLPRRGPGDPARVPRGGRGRRRQPLAGLPLRRPSRCCCRASRW